MRSAKPGSWSICIRLICGVGRDSLSTIQRLFLGLSKDETLAHVDIPQRILAISFDVLCSPGDAPLKPPPPRSEALP